MNLPKRNTSLIPFTPVCAAALLLALLVPILIGPAPAEAKVSVLAKVSPSASPSAPTDVRVLARTSGTVRRVIFLVDGHRRPVRRSVGWRHGRKGVLVAGQLRPGRHRVVAVAIGRHGAHSRGRRTIRLTRRETRRRPRHQTKSVALKPARPVAPAPTHSESSSSPLPPGVLFNGGFDNGFEGWHVQALSNDVSLFEQGAFSGTAAHFEVHEGDVEPETGSQRAEVSGPTFDEGQDLYVRDTIRVPASSSFSSDWQLVQQLREEEWGGSPGMAVFLEDTGELKIGAGDSSPMFWRGPIVQRDRWYDLVYRVKLSQDPSVGFVEVWLDGVPQQMLNGETRIYGQTMQRPQNYIKAGIYRSRYATGTSVVEHDNVIVGTSYDAVMAAG